MTKIDDDASLPQVLGSHDSAPAAFRCQLSGDNSTSFTDPTMTVKDAELVSATQAGRGAAFEHLVQRHQGLVCGVAFSQTGDPSLSEDLAQEAFTIAWQRLHQLEQPSKFGDWVAGIARNLGRAERKRRRREETRSDIDGVDAQKSPDEAIAERDAERVLWATLQQIPETYREALVLYYRHGQSTRQVAVALGISTSTAQQRLSRGRKQLRAEVERTLERSLARMRPRKTFAAAVIAGLPARGITGSATAGGMTMKWIAGGALALTALGGASWCHLDEQSVAASEPTEVKTATPGSRKDDERPAQRSSTDARWDDSDPAIAPVAPFEITWGETGGAAVSLAGGPVRVPDPRRQNLRAGSPDAPQPVRTVSGVVVDDGGHPVQGAVVLGGWLFLLGSNDTLRAPVAAYTDRRGAFSFEVPSDDHASVLALHHEFGWSRIESVGSGSSDPWLRLTLEDPPRLQAQVTRDEEPEPAAIILHRPGVDFWLFTNPEGWFEGSVPAAEYEVSVTRGADPIEVMDMKATPVSQTVRTVPTQTETLDVELPKGGMLALFVSDPQEKGIEQVSYTVLYGHHDIDSMEALREARKTQPHDPWPWLLVRGDSVGDPRTFSDLPPGPYTACATARKDFKYVLGLACKQVKLAAQENRELGLDLQIPDRE